MANPQMNENKSQEDARSHLQKDNVSTVLICKWLLFRWAAVGTLWQNPRTARKKSTAF